MMGQLMPLIQKQLQQISIPDINGKTGTPIGDIDYSLSAIRLHNLNFQTPSIVVSGADQLTVTISGVSAQLSCMCEKFLLFSKRQLALS